MKLASLSLVSCVVLAGCNSAEPVVVSTPPVVIERPLLKTKVRLAQFQCNPRPRPNVRTNRQASIFITKLGWNNADCSRKNSALLKMITDEK